MRLLLLQEEKVQIARHQQDKMLHTKLYTILESFRKKTGIIKETINNVFYLVMASPKVLTENSKIQPNPGLSMLAYHDANNPELFFLSINWIGNKDTPIHSLLPLLLSIIGRCFARIFYSCSSVQLTKVA